MKRSRRYILIVLVVVVTTLLSWWLFFGEKSQMVPPGGNGQPDVEHPIIAQTNDQLSPPIVAQQSTGNLPPHRRETIDTAADAKSVPITFWGKVIDQDGHPLSGVKVTMATRQFAVTTPLSLEPKFDIQSKISDVDGRFSITVGTSTTGKAFRPANNSS